LLLACNHPNSFLDGVIFATLFNEPVHSLARGDVFKMPVVRKLLAAVKLLPVYRTSEGVENLSANYTTFAQCHEIFEQNGIVLIFSEGRCVNEWHLRPLKKGTARLAISSWNMNIPLRVLPVGINYSSFRRFGKNVFINFGSPIVSSSILADDTDGMSNVTFNKLLNDQLQTLVVEASKKDTDRQRKLFELKPSIIRKSVLFLPAVAGWLIHFPLYLPIKIFTYRKTNHNDHYDSVIVALLFVAYPIYLVLVCLLLFYFTATSLSFFCLLLFPFLAWSYVQLKPQLDKI
jgi:1-acyl-sn-glycerol-3-phosphate acyltransferase